MYKNINVYRCIDIYQYVPTYSIIVICVRTHKQVCIYIHIMHSYVYYSVYIGIYENENMYIQENM